MPALAIATPILRVTCHAPWRTLLFVTVSAVALAASPRASAQQCGAPVDNAATCAVNPANYPDGVAYTELGDFTLNFDDGVIVTPAAAQVAVSSRAVGGVSTVNAPNVNITTAGDASHGMFVEGTGGATIDLGGSITTAGANSSGLFARSGGGAVAVTSAADISTAGASSHGIDASATTGAVSVTSTGDIIATGADANGILAIGTGEVTVDAGNTTGAAAGVNVSADTANVTVSGDVLGGAFGGVALTGATSATLTNNGSIGSTADLALRASSPDLTITNSGAITGFLTATGDAVTMDNSGTLELRNFTDTDASGAPDTEAVAVADFGGAGVFNNAAGGTVTLGDVAGATAWNLTGALLPEIGDPAGFDITLDGVEQGQLTGLTSFNNAGIIDLQDGVAGDVLAITGTAGEAPAPATYFSEGGTLLLDTVLNEGGSTASLSDVLMLDAAELGAGGSTLISIANAGGAGAQTIEDGILLVDVLDSTLSASGVFELDSFVIAGPWQYQLFQGGDAGTGGDASDGNWYLRSDLAPTTDAYRAYPSSMMRAARMAVGTLQQRVGNRWWHVPEQRTQRTVTDPAPPPSPMVRDFIVYFDWDKDDIRPDAADTIREAAEYAKSGNAARILVVGHTDTSGSAEYNMGLSERRANNVSSALQGEGVNAQVIGMEWLGETQPAVDTGDGVREQRNRRTTIQVAVPGTPDPNAAGRTRMVEEIIPATTEIQGSGVWGRIVGLDGEFQRDDDLGEIDETVFMAQGGVDFVVSQSDTGTVIASVAVHYVDTEVDVSTADFGDVASISSEGWGLSGGATWYSENGAYVDGLLSATWFEGDIDSDALGTLASGNEGFAWSASIEGGMRYEFKPNYYWVPQGQLIYTSVDIDEFTDPFGATVDEADSDSLIGRIGVAFEYLNRTTNENGDINRMQGYGIVNLLYEFLGAPGASASGIDLDEDIDDFWGELGAGFTYGFNSQWSVYGEGSYRTALENFGDSQAIQGSIGVRYNW